MAHLIPNKAISLGLSACFAVPVHGKESGPTLHANAAPALTIDRLAVGGDFMARRANTVPDSDSQAACVHLPMGRRMIEAAAYIFDITPAQVIGESRADVHCRARYAIMVALRRAGWSYPRIAARLGKRDHTTALHGVRRGEAIARSDAGFCHAVAILEGLAVEGLAA